MYQLNIIFNICHYYMYVLVVSTIRMCKLYVLVEWNSFYVLVTGCLYDLYVLHVCTQN